MEPPVHASSPLPHIGDLAFSAEDFPALYRRLTMLNFPLPVADILELRSALNIATDCQHERGADRARAARFAEIYRTQLSDLGVSQVKHVERLTCLLALLDELHSTHRRAARTTERQLRGAFNDNSHALRYSLRLAGVMGTGLLLSIGFLGAHSAVWVMRTLSVGTGYLSLDAFYSVTLLLRQRRTLATQLQQHSANSIETVVWPTLLRNLALVLGYSRGDSAQTAFVLDDAQDVRSA